MIVGDDFVAKGEAQAVGWDRRIRWERRDSIEVSLQMVLIEGTWQVLLG
jgi:hypothetical protein